MRGLKKESFTLLENGKPQRIETLTDESLPLELIATVDISASMERAMPQVQTAVKGLLARLRPGDTTTLLGFNESVFVLAERESDAALRDAAVDALVPWGGTAFFDATVRSLELVGQKAAGGASSSSRTGTTGTASAAATNPCAASRRARS